MTHHGSFYVEQKEINMTKKEHKERHKELHENLDEIFADFIENSGLDSGFTGKTIMELLSWSYKQSQEPDHKP